jgi:hypothetical protein
MRIAVLLASALAASCFVFSLKAEEVLKDKSPDGKLALQVYNGEEDWEAAIVDVRKKKALLDPDVYGISAGVLETS